MTSFPEPRRVSSNGIQLATYEMGAGEPVILLHGFPEIAYSWRHQLPALAGAGYRAIAIDQRGYGASDSPAAVEDYHVDMLIDDALGVLDALELPSATFVGHDWGALVLWQMAMKRPERIDGLVILNIPHFPRSPVDPIQIFRHRYGDDYYIVNFQDSDEADREFATDIDRFFDRIMRKNQISREQYEQLPADMQVINLLRSFRDEQPGGEPLLSAEERAVFVDAFKRSGFSGPINWYRNMTSNWESLAGVNEHIDIPTLFIGARDDVVISLEHIEGMRPLLSNLEIHMIDRCGHWSQQEHPDTVNRLMLDWLGRQ